MTATAYDVTPRNFVMLAGRVERDPKIHRNKSGGLMAVLDLRTQNVETGEWNDFHNMIAFGGLADWCEKNLRAGMRVCVQGQLALRRWKQGKGWRSRPQVIVRQLYLAPMGSEWAPLEKLLSDNNVEIDCETDAELGI